MIACFLEWSTDTADDLKVEKKEQEEHLRQEKKKKGIDVEPAKKDVFHVERPAERVAERVIPPTPYQQQPVREREIIAQRPAGNLSPVPQNHQNLKAQRNPVASPVSRQPVQNKTPTKDNNNNNIFIPVNNQGNNNNHRPLASPSNNTSPQNRNVDGRGRGNQGGQPPNNRPQGRVGNTIQNPMVFDRERDLVEKA